MVFSPFQIDCSVIEEKSGSSMPCQFPFIFLDQTYLGCTTIIDRKSDGTAVHGEPWCSTKTDSSNKHVAGQGYYGDCPKDGCANLDEGKSNYYLCNYL